MFSIDCDMFDGYYADFKGIYKFEGNSLFIVNVKYTKAAEERAP